MTNETLVYRLALRRMQDLVREGEAERRWRDALDARSAETPTGRTPRRLRRILLALR